jgi:hypothetical protein
MAPRHHRAAAIASVARAEVGVKRHDHQDVPSVQGPGDLGVREAYGAAGGYGDGAPPMTAARRRVQIPDLYCPFPPGVHPAAASVHAESVAWARAMGLVRSAGDVEALHKARVGWLVGHAFPVADRLPALQIASDWTTLFCLIDNHIENIRGPALSHVYLSGLLKVFREGAAPLIADPFAQAFRDLRERMLEVGVPTWIDRFAEQLAELFKTFVDEAKYRVLEAVPEVGRYRKMREVSVGLYFGFRLGELTDGITLPQSVREHPIVRELESRASYIVGLANDIYTVEKERARGEVNNMVFVLMHAEGVSFEEALAHVVELHDTETLQFMTIAAELPSFDPKVDGELRRYVDVLTSMISGHRTWADETARYHPGDLEDA